MVLLGDKRNFLSCFLTFSVIEDDIKTPTDNIDSFAVDCCRSIGCNVTKVTKIISGPDGDVLNTIQEVIDKANQKAISRAAHLQKWSILPLDHNDSTGKIGPTLKLKRFNINQKYHHAINRFYT